MHLFPKFNNHNIIFDRNLRCTITQQTNITPSMPHLSNLLICICTLRSSALNIKRIINPPPKVQQHSVGQSSK